MVKNNTSIFMAFNYHQCDNWDCVNDDRQKKNYI